MKFDLLELRRKAHKLKPVVMVGNNGVTENLLNEVECALNTHELIKIKLSSRDKEQRKEFCDKICSHCHAELIKTIGHTITIYRKKTE